MKGHGLPAEFPVRPSDALIAEVVVHVMVQPKVEYMTARELSQAAVEAVRSAVRRAEQVGHQHRLTDRVSLGMSEAVELRNRSVAIG